MTFDEWLQKRFDGLVHPSDPLVHCCREAWDTAICQAMNIVVQRNGVTIIGDEIAKLRPAMPTKRG